MCALECRPSMSDSASASTTAVTRSSKVSFTTSVSSALPVAETRAARIAIRARACIVRPKLKKKRQNLPQRTRIGTCVSAHKPPRPQAATAAPVPSHFPLSEAISHSVNLRGSHHARQHLTKQRCPVPTSATCVGRGELYVHYKRWQEESKHEVLEFAALICAAVCGRCPRLQSSLAGEPRGTSPRPD